jgi:hypothetical protein
MVHTVVETLIDIILARMMIAIMIIMMRVSISIIIAIAVTVMKYKILTILTVTHTRTMASTIEAAAMAKLLLIGGCMSHTLAFAHGQLQTAGTH